LVEIDIEYRRLAMASGVPHYVFVPAVGAAPDFIQGLARLIHRARSQKKDCVSDVSGRVCSPELSACPCKG